MSTAPDSVPGDKPGADANNTAETSRTASVPSRDGDQEDGIAAPAKENDVAQNGSATASASAEVKNAATDKEGATASKGEATLTKTASRASSRPRLALEPEDDAAVEYPHGLKLWLVIVSLCLAVFLVALDQTIIAPALGAITTEFKSVKDIVSLFGY